MIRREIYCAAGVAGDLPEVTQDALRLAIGALSLPGYFNLVTAVDQVSAIGITCIPLQK